MKPPRLTYVSDDFEETYDRMLDAAKSRSALLDSLREWTTYAPDALEAAKAMPAADFDEWRKGLASERTGTFAGEDWARRFGAITMPERMLRASMVAQQFQVPWGTAWIRLREEGLLDGGKDAA